MAWKQWDGKIYSVLLSYTYCAPPVLIFSWSTMKLKANDVKYFPRTGRLFRGGSYSLSLANTKHWKLGQKSAASQAFPNDAPASPDSVLMCSFVMCPPSPPKVIPSHFWTMPNPVEPGRTMALLDGKSNEAWNQYVQSCLTRGMLGNGVSGALWSCFNHRDLGISTRKQAAYCQSTTAPLRCCVFLCLCMWLLLI